METKKEQLDRKQRTMSSLFLLTFPHRSCPCPFSESGSVRVQAATPVRGKRPCNRRGEEISGSLIVRTKQDQNMRSRRAHTERGKLRTHPVQYQKHISRNGFLLVLRTHEGMSAWMSPHTCCRESQIGR